VNKIASLGVKIGTLAYMTNNIATVQASAFVTCYTSICDDKVQLWRATYREQIQL